MLSSAHRVLVIDDSKVQRLLAKGALEKSGCQVFEAATGAAGLEEARRRAFDCILLDWLLPDVSGEEILATLRREGVSTPILVVTSDDHAETRTRVLELGGSGLLDKPRNVAELVSAVAAAVG